MINQESFSDSLRKYDYTFFVIILGIFMIGILNLYSATHASDHLQDLYKTQLIRFVIAIVAGVVISIVQPKTIFRFAYPIYFINIFLLILVLVLGHEGMGAKRWLVLGPLRMQPSEFMKISVVLVLARWFSRNNIDRELGLRDLLIPFILAFFPALLIIMQPDLGTGGLVILIFLVMAFYRRLRWKSIAVLALIGLISGGVMFKFGLKDYQRKRVVTFLNPGADARGAGYNAIQSKIAIGSGQIVGKGFKKSTQASLNYLPENHTDFVFSIFNEERGFIGSLFLISLYLYLFYRFIWLSTSVSRMFDSIVSIGLMSIFFWHTFINMGMVMGMMPIVGLPLPLMSFGGSSLLTFGICCGLATSLSNGRNLF